MLAQEPETPVVEDSVIQQFRDLEPWYIFQFGKLKVLPLAMLALDATYYGQDEESLLQVGDQAARYEPGQIRVLNFGAVGTIGEEKPWRFVVGWAYRAFDQGFNADSATDITLQDLSLHIPTRLGTFSVGKMGEPLTLQRTMSFISIGSMERSMGVDGFMVARNNGLKYAGTYWKERIFFSAALYRNFSLYRGTSFKEAPTVIVSRLSINPIYNGGGQSDLHLGFGVRWSDFKLGSALKMHPEAYFASSYIETPHLTASSIRTDNLELAWRFRSLLLSSELSRISFDNPSIGSPVFHAYYAQLNWTLTGEQRRYIPGRAGFSAITPKRNVQRKGPGALEAGFRYSVANANSGQIEGGWMSRYSLFLSWYPTILSRLQFAYGFATLDRDGLIGHTHLYQIRFAVLIG